MAEIIISNLSRTTIKTNDQYTSILNALHANGVDWMHACGGKGRCTTCKMIVLKGLKNISDPSDFERKVKKLGALKENERLACQSKANGDIEIKVPEKNKLPHLNYSD